MTRGDTIFYCADCLIERLKLIPIADCRIKDHHDPENYEIARVKSITGTTEIRGDKGV